jgi:hypothetical protein
MYYRVACLAVCSSHGYEQKAASYPLLYWECVRHSCTTTLWAFVGWLLNSTGVEAHTIAD